jgi:protein PsiE
MSHERTWGKMYGQRVVGFLEDIGLVLILIAVVIAMAQEVHDVIVRRSVTLGDLLLLFIYLEVISMVGAYWETGQLPVRMPLYIAMVALARYLTLDMKALSSPQMIGIAVAILLLSFAVLVVRFGHVKFPYKEKIPEQPPKPPLSG